MLSNSHTIVLRSPLDKSGSGSFIPADAVPVPAVDFYLSPFALQFSNPFGYWYCAHSHRSLSSVLPVTHFLERRA